MTAKFSPQAYMRFGLKHIFIICILVLFLETVVLGVVSAEFSREPLWLNVALILLVVCFGFALIWACFLVYYHFTLPSEVMDLLVGEQPKRQLNDQLITALREHLQTYINERTIMITVLSFEGVRIINLFAIAQYHQASNTQI